MDWGQLQVGGLSGADASDKETEAPKGRLSPVRNRAESAKGKSLPDCVPETGNAAAKAWPSERRCLFGGGPFCRTSYPGSKEFVAGESTYRPRGLVSRCRLGLSWLCRRSQGSDCSSVKSPRELGSVRRKTVRSHLLGVLLA